MGDDFTGVVYLHGSLQQDARRLVVTDGDFGRAYLRDAWAARFLERMFATYTVLFVGYSHSDMVMQYLARALVSGSTRYVFTDRPDEPGWGRLGLLPVGYRVAGGSHAALGDAIAGWASLASMGLLDHRQRITDIVSASPQLIPEEASYLESVIANADQVRLFTKLARGEEWLTWVATQPEFRRLFDPAAPTTEVMSTLAWWFVEHFVMDEALTGLGMRVVNKAGGRVGPTLWSAIGQRLHMHGSPRPDWLRPWIVLLIEDDPQWIGHWLEYALMASRWPEDRTVALLLFDHLTELQTRMRPSYGQDGPPWFDIRLCGSLYELDEAWRDLFVPNLEQAAPDVLAIVDRQLRRGFNLLVTAGTARPGWDPLSSGRSAIEPHAEDRHRDPADILIDAARDSLEILLAMDDALGESYVNAWAACEIPILRRLALHAWSERPDRDGTAKIEWLRAQGWLFDHQLRHEVFRIIELALPTTTEEVANALVAAALRGPTSMLDEERRAYARFNLLSWIRCHAPDLQSAVSAIEQLQTEHPLFVEREHPDLLSRMEFGSVQPRPPMTANELHQRISDGAVGAVAELRRYENEAFPSGRPTWGDALGVLVETVVAHPADGLAVLDAVGSEHPDIMRSVIAGWSRADMAETTAERVLLRLHGVDLAAVANALAELLVNGGNDAHPTEWHRLPTAMTLAIGTWTALSTAAPDTDVENWLERTINDAAGKLALFWVHAIAADWRTAGDSWTGLSADTKAQLEAMLAGQDARTASAEVIFASQLLFFFGADRNWCQAHVLPLLDWVHPERARRAWDGYLTWGRYNDTLLTAGLLDDYLDTARHIEDFRDDLRRQLSSHLAGMALRSSINPLTWLPRFTTNSEVAQRVNWMNQVTWMLDDLDPDIIEEQWGRWMRQYWHNRLDSVPRELTTEEATALAPWAIYLTQSITQGVALATTRPAGLGERENTLHDITDERIRRAPSEFAKLIVHLLRTTEPPFWGCRHLPRILSELRRHTTPAADIDVIIAEAIRLGCSDAAQW